MKRYKPDNKSTRRGILTFEWILIFALLTIGIVGGLAAVRDMLILKYSDAADALGHVNSSYTVEAYTSVDHPEITAPAMTYTATVPTVTRTPGDEP